MPDTLYLNVVRYLNDLYWHKKLSSAQIKELAAFVLGIGESPNSPEIEKAETPDEAPKPFDETTQILCELFPSVAYAAQSRRN
jgi:hypothetical protein